MVSFFLLFCSTLAVADDMSRSDTIDRWPVTKSLVVQGIRFFVTPSTDYDDGLKGFADLREGQKVEVDFEYRDGKHYCHRN